MPSRESGKVTGRAGIDGLLNDTFYGSIYNGSETWTVTAFCVRVHAKDKRKKELWSREFLVSDTIRPLSAERFSIKIVPDPEYDSQDWAMTEVYGYESHSLVGPRSFVKWFDVYLDSVKEAARADSLRRVLGLTDTMSHANWSSFLRADTSKR